MNLALKCYPDRTDLVDQVLQNVDGVFQRQHVEEVPGDSAVCRELAKLLKIPLDHYRDILTVLQLQHYPRLLGYLHVRPRKELSLHVAHSIVEHGTRIAQQDQVEALLQMLTPLIEDHPAYPVDPADEEFVEEQTVVGKLIHFLRADELDQQYLILGVTRKFFGKAKNAVRLLFFVSVLILLNFCLLFWFF